MGTIKALIVEIHRRSLWQVLVVYVATSWFVLQVSEHVVERFLLPEWVYGGAVVLLLVGLPIVLATAIVREEPAGSAAARAHGPAQSAGDGGSANAASPAEVRAAVITAPDIAAANPASPTPGDMGASLRSSRVASLLTWPRAIAGGLAAFAILALISGFVVVRGMPRVAEARGSAGDAFTERGWIVIADFDAVDPDDLAVARAAREALTVDLQQSSFVNLFGRAQTAGVLERIGVPDTARLDLPLSLEVAERAGVGAVLGVTVSRLGPQYVLSARAIRVPGRDELFAVRAAAGSDRLLEGVEKLSREVRRRLGEERDAIRQSRPLPEVTTTSLDALKVYAEVEDAVMRHDHDRAASLVEEAIRLDPNFAMAYRAAGVIANNRLLLAEGRHYLTKAYELRDRLTDRERLHVEAFYHLQVTLEPRIAAEVYERLLARYPDDARAMNNMAVVVGDWLADTERAMRWQIRAVELNPHSGLMLLNLIQGSYQVGDISAADSLERITEDLLHPNRMRWWRTQRAFAEADYERAAALCDTLVATSPGALQQVRDRELCAAMDVARGRLRSGVAGLREAARIYRGQDLYRSYMDATVGLAMAEALRGDDAAAAAHLRAYLDAVPAQAVPDPDHSIVQTDLRVTASLLGQADMLARINAAYTYPAEGHIVSRSGGALAIAASHVAAGNGAPAVEVLRAAGPPPSGWRAFDKLLRGLAFELIEQPDSAALYLTLAAMPAYASQTRALVHLPFALRRLAEVEESRGNVAGAVVAYRRLLDMWADADPELQGEVAAIRRALARLGDEGG